MSIAHLLEEFDDRDDEGSAISMSEMKLEEEKLQAFERGYGAGWEDASKAEAGDREKVKSDFANNLRELSFTYHEAYGKMVKSLEPLLNRIVTSVLPDLARKSLGPQISEILQEVAKTVGEQAVEIVVGPGNGDLVREMLGNQTGFPLQVAEEPSLGEGQAYIRFGDAERQIDYDDVLVGVSRAVEAFFHELDQSIESEVQDAG